jgi:hypothetical protein
VGNFHSALDTPQGCCQQSPRSQPSIRRFLHEYGRQSALQCTDFALGDVKLM